MKHEPAAEFAHSLPERHSHQVAIEVVAPLGEFSDSAVFQSFKRAFDVVGSLVLLPLLGALVLVLLFANRFGNRGPVFFVQSRMGQNCVPFNAYKLRTMRPVDVIERSADCPLETDRITPIGHMLRKTRLDELPQLLNVLKGEMSLIGPRPDYYVHACYFLENVPGYRRRHNVRPGISGLAQTEVGYVAGAEATRRKVSADLYYIRNRSFRLEAFIIWRTIAVVFGRGGA